MGGHDMEEKLFDAYPDIMTVLQVSEALHIGRNSAYNLINSNSIRHLRIGSSIRVPKSCLVEYVASAWFTAKKQAALTVRKETEMTGSLQVKNDKFYIIVNLKENGKRKQKWIATGLDVKGNKRKAHGNRLRNIS